MRVADLEELIGPPIMRPPAVNWVKLESALNLTFPSDHKELCARYSTLEFDRFLSWGNSGMWRPGLKIRGVNLDLEFLRERRRFALEITVVDDFGVDSRRPMFPIYPEEGGLLVWGGTQNGHSCMWLMDGAPDEWTIVIGKKGDFWQFQGGLLDFLVGMEGYSKQVSEKKKSALAASNDCR